MSNYFTMYYYKIVGVAVLSLLLPTIYATAWSTGDTCTVCGHPTTTHWEYTCTVCGHYYSCVQSTHTKVGVVRTNNKLTVSSSVGAD